MVNKKILIIIAIVIVIALVGGGLYLAYEKRQEAEEAKKAAEEAARKEAEAEKEKESAETSEQKEKKSLSEQIEEEIKKEGESAIKTPEELQELIEKDQDLKKMEEAYRKEYKEIKKVLEQFNRLDNTYDYRTVTLESLLEGAKYLEGEYRQKYEDYMPAFLQKVKNEKIVKEFDSIEIRLLMFTKEDFKTLTKDYNNLTYAYAEVEIRAKQINPKEESTNSLFFTKLQKIEGQWKIVSEGFIKNLE